MATFQNRREFRTRKNMFSGTRINITSTGKRHLGAVFGSQDYKDEYVNDLVASWKGELQTLAKIAESQPQAAYSAYIHGFKGKVTYFLRTIPNITAYLEPIEEVLRNEFIPALTGGTLCSDEDREILALPVRLGGLGIEIVGVRCQRKYESSRKVTESLVESVISQQNDFTQTEETVRNIKNTLKKDRRAQNNKN